MGAQVTDIEVRMPSLNQLSVTLLNRLRGGVKRDPDNLVSVLEFFEPVIAYRHFNSLSSRSEGSDQIGDLAAGVFQGEGAVDFVGGVLEFFGRG